MDPDPIPHLLLGSQQAPIPSSLQQVLVEGSRWGEGTEAGGQQQPAGLYLGHQGPQIHGACHMDHEGNENDTADQDDSYGDED